MLPLLVHVKYKKDGKFRFNPFAVCFNSICKWFTIKSCFKNYANNNVAKSRKYTIFAATSRA